MFFLRQQIVDPCVLSRPNFAWLSRRPPGWPMSMTGRCKDRNWTDNGVTSVKSSDLGPISRKKHQLSIVKKKTVVYLFNNDEFWLHLLWDRFKPHNISVNASSFASLNLRCPQFIIRGCCAVAAVIELFCDRSRGPQHSPTLWSLLKTDVGSGSKPVFASFHGIHILHSTFVYKLRLFFWDSPE